MTSRADALKHFKRVDPRFHEATRAHHASLPARLPEKKTRAKLFEALVSIVISQQLGTAAADTIFARVKKVCGGKLTPESVQKVSSAKLAKAGLSSAKIKTIKTLARRSGAARSICSRLKKVPEDEVTERLTALWGLGPWSVEMFSMFSLGGRTSFCRRSRAGAGDGGHLRPA